MGPLSRLYDAYLYPSNSPRPDFLSPPGEPALVPEGSVSWRVFANPVTLFVGGVLAVILELALPKVRHGVWDHSTFRADPKGRLQRTGLAAMVTIYGPESAALKMIAGVNAAHARVSGVTRAGEPYDATDTALLIWVQATAAFGFGAAYDALARPMTPAQWDVLFAESRPIAEAYGAKGAPVSTAEWRALLERTAPKLETSEVVETFLALMADNPVLPAIARPIQGSLVRAAVGLVPPKAGLALPRWQPSRADRALAKTAASVAERLRIASSPPVLACRRLGLDPNDVLSGPLPSPETRTAS